jgi:hypothetical protein
MKGIMIGYEITFWPQVSCVIRFESGMLSGYSVNGGLRENKLEALEAATLKAFELLEVIKCEHSKVS